MKSALVAAAVVLALGGATQAKSLTEKTGVNEVLGVSPSTADFVSAVAISDMFEIQSSKLAKARGQGSVAAFAAKMIDDHSKTSNELKGLVEKGAVKQQPPTALDGAHQKKMESLKSASGADFTTLYVKDQVSAHKDAIDLFERYAKGGDNEALEQWAAATLPALRHHLQMAQDLSKNDAAGRSEFERCGGR